MEMDIGFRLCVVLIVFGYGFALRFDALPVILLCICTFALTLRMRGQYAGHRMPVIGIAMIVQVMFLWFLGVRELLFILCGMTNAFAMVMWAGVCYQDMEFDAMMGIIAMIMFGIILCLVPTALGAGIALSVFGPLVWRHRFSYRTQVMYAQRKRSV